MPIEGHGSSPCASVHGQQASLGGTTDIGAARKRVDGKVALQGNMDPLTLFASPEAVAKEATRILDCYAAAGDGNTGHVFNLGHGIGQHTPIAHVERLVAAVRGWRG